MVNVKQPQVLSGNISENAKASEYAAFSVTVARFVVAEEDGFDSRTSDHMDSFDII